MFYCEECGQNLLGVSSILPTRKFEKTAGDLSAKATWGTAHFHPDAKIVLHIRDAVNPIVVEPDRRRVVLGRADAHSQTQPDLDLTTYGAIEKGVSRIHAVLERSDDTLTLTDLGSSNGTHLNGQRLGPDQPRVLRDGDEVRLGKLVANIFFM
jgi:hypothetical protein